MKKKLFLGTLLAGTLAFTACVDDKVPAEVEQIRQAKAAQLTSMATLANAQADANVAIANANAQAKKAQAAYDQARAALYNARTQAAVQDAQNKMQEAAMDIEKAQSKLEVALAQAKLAVFNAQQSLKANLQNLKDNEASQLQGYITAYVSAQENLLTLRGSLASAKNTLEGIKSGFNGLKEAYTQSIESATEKLEAANEVVDFYTEELSVWNQYSDNHSAAVDALKAAEAQMPGLLAAKDEAQTNLKQAGLAQQATLTSIKNSPYYGALENLATTIQDIQVITWSTSVSIQSANFTSLPSDERMSVKGGAYAVYTDEDGNWNSIDLVGCKSLYKYVEYSKAEGQKLTKAPYYQYQLDTLTKDGFKNLNTLIEARLEAGAVEDSINAAKALAAADRIVATLEKQQNAQTVADNAQKAVDEAGDKVTEAQTKALNDAKDALAKAETNLNDSTAKYGVDNSVGAIHFNQQSAANSVANANAVLEEERGVYADFKALQATLTAQAESFEALVNTLNGQIKDTKAGEFVAYQQADNAYNVTDNEVTALKAIVATNTVPEVEVKVAAKIVLNGTTYSPGQMAPESTSALEALLAQAQAEAAAAQEKLDEETAKLADFESAEHPDVDAAIAEAQANVAQLELEVKAAEAKVAITEAQMKKALGEE